MWWVGIGVCVCVCRWLKRIQVNEKRKSVAAHKWRWTWTGCKCKSRHRFSVRDVFFVCQAQPNENRQKGTYTVSILAMKERFQNYSYNHNKRHHRSHLLSTVSHRSCIWLSRCLGDCGPNVNASCTLTCPHMILGRGVGGGGEDEGQHTKTHYTIAKGEWTNVHWGHAQDLREQYSKLMNPNPSPYSSPLTLAPTLTQTRTRTRTFYKNKQRKRLVGDGEREKKKKDDIENLGLESSCIIKSPASYFSYLNKQVVRVKGLGKVQLHFKAFALCHK